MGCDLFMNGCESSFFFVLRPPLQTKNSSETSNPAISMQNGSVSSAKSNWGGGEGVACCSNWKTKRACAPGRLAARVRSEGGSGGKWPALAWSSMFWRSDSGA